VARPSRQCLQLAGSRAELAGLAVWLIALSGREHAGHDGVFVNVERGASRMQHGEGGLY
jgi:hypothetical protein